MANPFESDNGKFIKNYIKTMPIWEHFDKFKAEFELTKYEMQNYLCRLEERGSRCAKFPNLKLTHESRVLSSDNVASNDQDIVLTYRKIHGTYQFYDTVKELERREKATRDPFRDMSIVMLEEKITADEEVYAMDKPCKPWVKCKITSIFRRPTNDTTSKLAITFRLKTSDPSKPPSLLPARDKYQVARIQDHGENLHPPKRVIAGLGMDLLMPGIIGEQPHKSNKNRYLVHMDDGSARYFKPEHVLPILGQTSIPWLDGAKVGDKNPDNAVYLRCYYSAWPKKHILKAIIGENLTPMRNGMVVPATLIGIDCNTIRLLYKDNTEESIYRGSPRLMKRADVVAKQLASQKNLDHFNEILLIHTHLYYEASRRALDEDMYGFVEDFDKKIKIGQGHNTARKSTAKRSFNPTIKVSLDGQAVPEDRDQIDHLREDSDAKSHQCSPSCLGVPGLKTETSVEDIIDEFRDVSDLKVPLLLGWKRRLQKISSNTRSARVKIAVTYEAPCGKLFSQPYNIRRYLMKTGSIFDVDYFSFDRDIELNRQFGDFSAYYYVPNMAVDFKTGKPLENKNISLINQFSEERLPQDFEYRNESFPHPMLKSRGFSFNQDFKSSCDCDDDCSTRAACACHRLNEEFYGSNGHNRGTVENRCQYNHKRLTTQVATGIFECNSFCKCSSKCSNRVVQNGIRFRLQVRKTLNKGWGVITLDDIPSGAFICTYSAELLDDADMYGDSDMYYADLDYITENERTKAVESDEEKSDEGVDTDSDVDEQYRVKKKKRSDRRVISDSDESQEGTPKGGGHGNSSSSSDNDVEVIDNYMPRENSTTRANSRYPKRKVQNQLQNQAMQGSESRPKFKKIHDLLKSHDFTLDARMQGNVGRFFNHSCDPNSYVQNIFIETHDLRFPEVAFFAMRTIKALSEITWNYRYKVGSIPGRRIDCQCGSSNCAGRIL